MDDTKIELPAWLPWATTACLAALAACLVELWMIERARSEILQEKSQIAEAAVKASDNQLEAERIMSARQFQDLRSKADPDSGLQVIVLYPPTKVPARVAASGPLLAVAVVDPAGNRGQLRLYGDFGQPADQDYQLWIDGPGEAYPAPCALFHVALDRGPVDTPVKVAATLAPGCQFILIDGTKGGAANLGEARAAGSIVLASPPFSGKISN